MGGHGQYRSQYLGKADEAEICCGQVAGLIENVAAAGDVLDGLARELKALSARLAGFLMPV